MSKAKNGKPPVPDAFRNRIVGHGEEAPEQLLANEGNWRIHPRPQQEALTAVLDEVGYVQSVIVNKRLGAAWPDGQRGVETMVDGHLRTELAISKGQKKIPVVYVDLDPTEEAKILATFDPLGAMAATDKAKLEELLREVNTGSEALAAMLGELAAKNGVIQPDESDLPNIDETTMHSVAIHYTDAEQELLLRFIGATEIPVRLGAAILERIKAITAAE